MVILHITPILHRYFSYKSNYNTHQVRKILNSRTNLLINVQWILDTKCELLQKQMESNSTTFGIVDYTWKSRFIHSINTI